MKDERIMILKMVESGKINADEAVKLLNAVNTSGKTSDMLSNVKKSVSDIAKAAEPKVKAAAEKGIEIGNSVKKKVEKKINESKLKEKAEDIIDEVEEFFDDEDIIEEYDSEEDVVDETTETPVEEQAEETESE